MVQKDSIPTVLKLILLLVAVGEGSLVSGEAIWTSCSVRYKGVPVPNKLGVVSEISKQFLALQFFGSVSVWRNKGRVRSFTALCSYFYKPRKPFRSPEVF